MLAQDMVSFVTTLQEHLKEGSLKNLRPILELVGSMAERTRIGIANELDLTLKFLTWRENIPFMVRGDPFSLKKAPTSQDIMDDFFCEEKFQFHKFVNFLLNAVDTEIQHIFGNKKNPPNLKCVTTNKEWNEGQSQCKGECKDKLMQQNYEQCQICAVTLSQTKSGIVLQFVWECDDNNVRIYCSIDLIPSFPITPIASLQLVKLIMANMLGDNPPCGWLNFLFKYAKDYKLNLQLNQDQREDIRSVGLKTMNFFSGRNHFIKPAHDYNRAKFSSERMKNIYTYIKFLKKVLDLDLSSFLVKKELLKDKYQSILDGAEKDDVALLLILSEPEFRIKMENSIDFTESHRWGPS